MMKHASACQQCRKDKRRCQGLQPGEACVRCARKHFQCSRTSTARGRLRLAPSNPRSVIEETGGGISLSQDVIQELVDKYLLFIHDRPHSLFHQPTLETSVRRKSISKALLYSICGMGSRFSNVVTVRLLGPQLLAESKRLLQLDLENICLENIQTCILVANLCAAEAVPSSEALYFGIANRMAHIIGLTTTNPADSDVLRETKHRVWWTLFMADRWCSSGLGLPRELNYIERPVALPMDEYIFHNHNATQGDMSKPMQLGLWAYMITLVEIFGPIQDLNRSLVQGIVGDIDVNRQVQDLSWNLQHWEDTLPLGMKFGEDNLYDFQRKGLGGPFVALHLGYHHYATLLYFQFLDTERPTLLENAGAHADSCKHHASAFSALLKLARENERCEAVYPTVGHMTLVSSAVLIHTLLFGEEYEVKDARDCLIANFEALVELTNYWPSLKGMMNRLFLFQNACLWATQSYTHKLDKWMLRFLYEHSLPLEAKGSRVEEYATATRFSAFPPDKVSQRGAMANNVLSRLVK